LNQRRVRVSGLGLYAASFLYQSCILNIFGHSCGELSSIICTLEHFNSCAWTRARLCLEPIVS